MEKKYEITNAFVIDKVLVRHSELKDVTAHGTAEMSVSDGYHTMDELYEHRMCLWIVLCHAVWAMSIASRNMGHPDMTIPVWRTKKHSDGELAFGGKWFVLGMYTEKGKQITYHLPIARWEECNFADILEKSPEFDGHTSADVLERLKNSI